MSDRINEAVDSLVKSGTRTKRLKESFPHAIGWIALSGVTEQQIDEFEKVAASLGFDVMIDDYDPDEEFVEIFIQRSKKRESLMQAAERIFGGAIDEVSDAIESL